MSRLPDFLIIGAMKCGTTSLHDYLSLHPDIFMSKEKEIHYYADEFYKNKPLKWYTDAFHTDKKVAGTSPQSYTKRHNKFYQNIPERIQKNNPNVKLIYIVRDPIKRYLSHIIESSLCDVKEDIDYSKESNNYLLTSKYYYQISLFLEYFDKSQIHILSLEKLKDDKLNELNKIFDFLGVDKMNDESIFEFISNKKDLGRIPRRINTNYLYRFGKKVFPRLTATMARIFSKKMNKKYEKKFMLDETQIQQLKSELSDDIQQFRELTGLSFAEWSI